jgi:hypothetical protein
MNYILYILFEKINVPFATALQLGEVYNEENPPRKKVTDLTIPNPQY